MNLGALAIVAVMLWLRRKHRKLADDHGGHDHGGGGFGLQDAVTALFIAGLAGGGVALALTGSAG